MMGTTTTITTAQIRQLRTEAADAGDDAQVLLCDRALGTAVRVLWGAVDSHDAEDDDWDATFAAAAAALLAIGEDVYGDDNWAEADEGCQRVTTADQAAVIEEALATVPGIESWTDETEPDADARAECQRVVDDAAAQD